MKVFLRLASLMGVVLLAACQPSFIADETESFSRQLGVIEDFDISRWHSRVFSHDSRFVFYTSSADKEVQKAINMAGTSAFKRHFAAAESSDANSRGQAKADARMVGAHFLVVIEILSSQTDVDGNKVKERNHKKVQVSEKVYKIEGEPYKSVEILMTIIAMNTDTIVDKVSLASDKLFKPYPGLNKLLQDPMQAVASELSGG